MAPSTRFVPSGMTDYCNNSKKNDCPKVFVYVQKPMVPLHRLKHYAMQIKYTYSIIIVDSINCKCNA